MAEAAQLIHLARYPFLAEAREWIRDEEYALGDLLTDPVYEGARRRAVARVKGALAKEGIADPSLASEREATFELLSYPLARALVATLEDPYLASRYAVAESKLLTARLSEEGGTTVWSVAEQVGIPLQETEQAFAKVHFADFLRNAPARDPAWKLVNRPLQSGFVDIDQGDAIRLAEEALRDRLQEELEGLRRPGRTLLAAFERDLNEIRMMLAAHRERFASETGGPLRVEAFPPCMQAIWKGIQGHVNIPHMGRFAIVSFLHTLGMSSEEILAFFSTVPDFDVNKSRYQIEHITGKIGASEYTPPGCGTMQTYGICPLEQRDEICLKLIHHPLAYYRKKARWLGPPRPAPVVAAEVTDAAQVGTKPQ